MLKTIFHFNRFTFYRATKSGSPQNHTFSYTTIAGQNPAGDFFRLSRRLTTTLGEWHLTIARQWLLWIQSYLVKSPSKSLWRWSFFLTSIRRHMSNKSQAPAVHFSEKHVKTLWKRWFFSPGWNRPIIFRKLWHRISIWTTNGTDILKSVSKENLMASYFF